MFFDKGGRKTAVVSILGQAGFGRVHLANPLQVIDSTIDRLGRDTTTIIVDYHATTTAEKNTLYYHLRGRVSALIGTHQRVMTADGRVDGGTAFITEAGRTGSRDSVGGFDSETEIRQFLTQIPEPSKTAWESLELQGVIVDIDENGKAETLRTIRRACKEKPDGRTGHSQQR
jgi:calcineurin-like phosphoesterase